MNLGVCGSSGDGILSGDVGILIVVSASDKFSLKDLARWNMKWDISQNTGHTGVWAHG